MKHAITYFIRPVLATIWLATSMALHAQTPAKAAQATQFTLPNGMTVIIKPDRRAPTAVHMLWVRVGSMEIGRAHV